MTTTPTTNNHVESTATGTSCRQRGGTRRPPRQRPSRPRHRHDQQGANPMTTPTSPQHRSASPSSAPASSQIPPEDTERAVTDALGPPLPVQ